MSEQSEYRSPMSHSACAQSISEDEGLPNFFHLIPPYNSSRIALEYQSNRKVIGPQAVYVRPSRFCLRKLKLHHIIDKDRNPEALIDKAYFGAQLLNEGI